MPVHFKKKEGIGRRPQLNSDYAGRGGDRGMVTRMAACEHFSLFWGFLCENGTWHYHQDILFVPLRGV
jgi:hypothetical protein